MQSYIFATYESDKRKSKIRNRFLLLFSILFIVYLLIPSMEEQIEPVVEKEVELKKEVVVKKEEAKMPVPSIKEIKEIIEREESVYIEDTKIEETSSGVEEMLNPYYIQIGTILYVESFQDKLTALEKNGIAYELFQIGEYKKVLVGPYNGYSKAKEELNQVQAITGIKDAFIKEYK